MNLLKEKELFCVKKFDNFCNAYINLKDIFDYDEPYGNVVLTGLVGLHEVWKS